MDKKARLFSLLNAHAVKFGDFTLASGQKSHVYCNCKEVAFRGEAQALLGSLLYERMTAIEAREKFKFEGVGGMALGAVPLATALSYFAHQQGRELPTLVARKDIKAHGTAASLEGTSALAPGKRVFLVEDVTTTGGSTLKAASAFRASDYRLSHVVSILDREQGGKENMYKAELSLESLFVLSDFENQNAC